MDDTVRTKLKSCTCEHKIQDKMYGKKIRVMNKTADGKWRCTVCGNVKIPG